MSNMYDLFFHAIEAYSHKDYNSYSLDFVLCFPRGLFIVIDIEWN